MGSSPSRPAPPPAPKPAPKAAPVPPPVNTLSTCAVKKVELNQLTRDITTKQSEIDSCDPVESQTRKTQIAIRENQNYVDQKRSELEKALTEFNTQRSIVRKLSEATEPLKQYVNVLESEVESMDTKKRKLENAERTSRRLFLDNDPQSGVNGFLGIRTSDDKIVLMFWICYFLAIVVVTAVLMNMFGTQITMKNQLIIGTGIVFLSWFIAYYCITIFG